MDETRALLDALMGPNRNSKADKTGKGELPDFVEKSICKNFLVGFCPHDWFTMAKRQLKPCNKIHSDMMRANFEAHPDADKYRVEWEEDFLAYLERIAADCDAYIARERPKCRPKGSKVVRLPSELKERCDEKEKLYADLISLSEALADESLSKSQAKMQEALSLKEEIDTLKARYTFEFPGEDVCDACGVRYPGGAGWEGHDKESHMRGKTHIGMAQIRDKIEQLRKRGKEWDKMRDKHRSWFKEQRRAQDKVAEKERDEERRKEKEREKDRERKREEALERQRELDKLREKERAKEKEKEKEKSRHKEKGGEKDRDRDRNRDRDRDRKKDRSRSRDRSDSGDKKKEKEKHKRKASSSSEPSRNQRPRTEAPPAPSAPPPAPSQPMASEVSGDGENVEERDLPAFWARLGTLPPDQRQEAIKGLNPASTERLETWLVARIAARKPKG